MSIFAPIYCAKLCVDKREQRFSTSGFNFM